MTHLGPLCSFDLSYAPTLLALLKDLGYDPAAKDTKPLMMRIKREPKMISEVRLQILAEGLNSRIVSESGHASALPIIQGRSSANLVTSQYSIPSLRHH